MPGLFCERARAPDFNGERIARSKPRSGMRHPQTRQGRPSFTPMYCRNWLLSASISSWTSWTSGNVQNHAVPNTSFRLSNSNPGRVDVVAFACEVRISRRVSLFIVDPNACAPSREKQGRSPTPVNGCVRHAELGSCRAHLLPHWLALLDKGSLDLFWIYGG
jgi:hypothetical protein